jgi:hypothetical protein
MRSMVMKWTTILLISVSLLALVFMAFQWYSSQSTSKTESYGYTVVKTFDDFEIRAYDAALFSYVNMEKQAYRNASGSGFRVLAGYIFGGNETEEKIAMTTPVRMEMGDTMRMAFMVPKAYTLEELPKPNDQRIAFEREEERIVAAICFGGWADDESIEEYMQKLLQALEREGIQAKGNIEFLGYNPPYEMVNRRNEVIVEVEYSDASS